MLQPKYAWARSHFKDLPWCPNTVARPSNGGPHLLQRTYHHLWYDNRTIPWEVDVCCRCYIERWCWLPAVHRGPLLILNTLVSCLEFAATWSSMPLVEQILLTLMKRRQNFVIADLARGFKRSPGQISKRMKFWIVVVAEQIKELIPWLPCETMGTLQQVFKENFPNTTLWLHRKCEAG